MPAHRSATVLRRRPGSRRLATGEFYLIRPRGAARTSRKADHCATSASARLRSARGSIPPPPRPQHEGLRVASAACFRRDSSSLRLVTTHVNAASRWRGARPSTAAMMLNARMPPRLAMMMPSPTRVGFHYMTGHSPCKITTAYNDDSMPPVSAMLVEISRHAESSHSLRCRFRGRAVPACVGRVRASRFEMIGCLAFAEEAWRRRATASARARRPCRRLGSSDIHRSRASRRRRLIFAADSALRSPPQAR